MHILSDFCYAVRYDMIFDKWKKLSNAQDKGRQHPYVYTYGFLYTYK